MVDCFTRPFALHFCPQRCWSRQISWITCALRTDTVTNRCCVNRQITVSLLLRKYQTAVLTYWPTDSRHLWLTDCWSRTSFCCDSFLPRDVHRESKKQDTKLLAITSPTISLSDFQNFFTIGLGSKFATNSCITIPPRFKHVATLPCEIWMSKNGIILKYVLQLMTNHKIV